MDNSAEILLFETTIQTEIMSLAKQYVKYSILKKSEDDNGKEVFNQCQTEILEKVLERQQTPLFNELIILYSGYRLID